MPVPDGSRPTVVHSPSPTMPSASVSVKTLEMLWMENGNLGVAGDIGLAVDRDHRDPELRRIDFRELRNVVGDFAAGLLPGQRAMDVLDQSLQIA